MYRLKQTTPTLSSPAMPHQTTKVKLTSPNLKLNLRRLHPPLLPLLRMLRKAMRWKNLKTIITPPGKSSMSHGQYTKRLLMAWKKAKGIKSECCYQTVTWLWVMSAVRLVRRFFFIFLFYLFFWFVHISEAKHIAFLETCELGIRTLADSSFVSLGGITKNRKLFSSGTRLYSCRRHPKHHYPSILPRPRISALPTRHRARIHSFPSIPHFCPHPRRIRTLFPRPPERRASLL